jgi:COMPASS component SWD3
VTGVKFSHDGETLATTSYDGLCRLWSVATGACLKTLTLSVGVGGRGVSGDGDGDGDGDGGGSGPGGGD